MTTLPEPTRQHYAAPAGQPMPGWPTTPTMSLTGPVELYGEADPVVYVQDAYGQSVAVRKSQVHPMQPMPARDLAPAPLIDPRAQMMVGGGVLAAGTGWGLGQVVGAFAAISSGALMWLAIAIVAAKMAPAVGRGRTTVNKTVHNHNSWWGKSDTRI